MANDTQGFYYENSPTALCVVCGKKLRALRENKGKSITDVAKDLNISFAALSYFETGKKFPSPKTQLALADYYNVAWADLFENSCY